MFPQLAIIRAFGILKRAHKWIEYDLSKVKAADEVSKFV